MIHKKIVLLTLVFGISLVSTAQQTPAPKQQKSPSYCLPIKVYLVKIYFTVHFASLTWQDLDYSSLAHLVAMD